MDEGRDWSWLSDPQWIGSFLVAIVLLLAFRVPPLRDLWLEAKLGVAGITLMGFGVLVEPMRDGLFAVGTIMFLLGVTLFFRVGSMEHVADVLPEGDRTIDHSVAPHDVDDPSTLDVEPDATDRD
jgi:hypothetical protein